MKDIPDLHAAIQDKNVIVQKMNENFYRLKTNEPYLSKIENDLASFICIQQTDLPVPLGEVLFSDLPLYAENLNRIIFKSFTDSEHLFLLDFK
jgi:hypothetical protein